MTLATEVAILDRVDYWFKSTTGLYSQSENKMIPVGFQTVAYSKYIWYIFNNQSRTVHKGKEGQLSVL